MPEVHAIGEVQGAAGFSRNGLHCEWKAIYDSDSWTLSQGVDSGVTQVDASERFGTAVWNHPVDMAFSLSTLSGWPKLRFRVWYQDLFFRNLLGGYGTIFMPMSPGVHDLQVPIWRPRLGFMENLSSYFIEDHPQLESLDCLTDEEDRYDLETESTGYVYLRLNIITEGFHLGADVHLGEARVQVERVRDLRCVPVPVFENGESVEPVDHIGGSISQSKAF